MRVPGAASSAFAFLTRRVSRQTVAVAALVSVGYVLGATDLLNLNSSSAQAPDILDVDDAMQQVDVSDEAAKQIQAVNEYLTSAMETLRAEGKYVPATEDMNPYLVLSGGGNAIDDLERGTGVDPLTFAGLYAGRAVREVEDELRRDEQGRLYYKNNLVRMYSVDRLQKRDESHKAILEKRVLP